MQKLIQKFKACPSPSNREKLQKKLDTGFAACFLYPEEIAFLRDNGFTI